MSSAAVVINDNFETDVVSDAVSAETPEIKSNNLSLEITVLGSFLILLQILDGILTGIGVGHFGVWAEGNYLVRVLMQHVGHVPALLLVKTIAIASVGGLCWLAPQVSWMGKALKSLILVYLVFAVVPWTLILARHIFFAC